MNEIFQYIQFQLKPFNIWLQYIILEKDKQPDRGMLEIDLQIKDLKTQIIDLINYLINKFQIQDFQRFIIHCGTGDFWFLCGNKETEPISLEQLTPEWVGKIRIIVSQLIKFKKPDFNDTDLFYTKHRLASIEECKYYSKKAGIILTDKEAEKRLKKSKTELDKFINERPDLRKLKE